MKIVTQREQILEPLQQIASVVERRQTLPILSNILINVKNNKLHMTATDLEVELKTEVEADCDGEADFTIPARKILDICKALPEDAKIDIEVEKDKTKLISGRSRFSLGILPARDYPLIEVTASNSVIKIKESIIKRLIDKTQFAMAQQDVRYYLNGMLFEVMNGNLSMVATDGHRLAISQVKGELDKELDIQIILPRKAVLELGRLLKYRDNEITIELNNNYFKVLMEKSIFTTKLIDGKFPEYQRVMPSGLDKEVKSEREQMRQSLTRASILSNEKYRGIRFNLSSGTLQLQAHNPEQEEAEEEMEIDYQGEELTIGFNVGYLLDAISVIEEEQIIIELKDQNSSALIYGVDNSESKYVIMPMRI